MHTAAASNCFFCKPVNSMDCARSRARTCTSKYFRVLECNDCRRACASSYIHSTLLTRRYTFDSMNTCRKKAMAHGLHHYTCRDRPLRSRVRDASSRSLVLPPTCPQGPPRMHHARLALLAPLPTGVLLVGLFSLLPPGWEVEAAPAPVLPAPANVLNTCSSVASLRP